MLAGGTTDELVQPRSVCLPGEVVVRATGDATIVLGRGLQVVENRQRRRPQPRPAGEAGGDQSDDDEGKEPETVEVVATCGGPLSKELVTVGTSPETGLSERAPQYSVVSDGAKRYVPQQGDAVVGVVIRVNGANSYTVHLGAASAATLDSMAFDGASKMSRPKMAIGDLVYAHVVTADADAETEISCLAVGDMPRKDWTTGEAVFGKLLAGGASVVVPIAHANALVNNTNSVLLTAGSRVPFEAVIGLNGRVWLRVADGVPRKALVALTRCATESAECQTAAESEALVNKYFPPPAAVASSGTAPPPPASGSYEAL